jgi:hypothetical protein
MILPLRHSSTFLNSLFNRPDIGSCFSSVVHQCVSELFQSLRVIRDSRDEPFEKLIRYAMEFSSAFTNLFILQ